MLNSSSKTAEQVPAVLCKLPTRTIGVQINCISWDGVKSAAIMDLEMLSKPPLQSSDASTSISPLSQWLSKLVSHQAVPKLAFGPAQDVSHPDLEPGTAAKSARSRLQSPQAQLRAYNSIQLLPDPGFSYFWWFSVCCGLHWAIPPHLLRKFTEIGASKWRSSRKGLAGRKLTRLENSIPRRTLILGTTTCINRPVPTFL